MLPAIFAIGISFAIRHQLKLGLIHCHWLDQQLQRSGCVQKITLDAEALGVFLTRSLFPRNSTSLAIAPDGLTIAVAAQTLRSNPNQRKVWGITIAIVNRQRNTVTQTLEVDETVLDTGQIQSNMRVYGFDFSPQGDLLTASIGVGAVRAIYIWDVQTGDRRLRLTGDYCPQLKFSPDGQFVLCPERKLRIEDGAVLTLTEPDRRFLDQYWSDGKLLGEGEGEAIAPDRDIKASIKDLNTLIISRLQGDVDQEIISLGDEIVLGSSSQLKFSPDGRKLLVYLFGAQELYLWQRGKSNAEEFSTDTGLAEVAWFSDSDRIAVNYLDGTLKIFNAD